jgi:hypothetical protein
VLPNTHLDVKPTLQIKSNARVFALGDVIEWEEPHQAAKTPKHAAVVVSNIVAILHSLDNGVKDPADIRGSMNYTGSLDAILITNGRVSLRSTKDKFQITYACSMMSVSWDTLCEAFWVVHHSGPLDRATAEVQDSESQLSETRYKSDVMKRHSVIIVGFSSPYCFRLKVPYQYKPERSDFQSIDKLRCNCATIFRPYICATGASVYPWCALQLPVDERILASESGNYPRSCLS